MGRTIQGVDPIARRVASRYMESGAAGPTPDIIFRHYEEDPNDKTGVNKGWRVARIEALVDGTVVGYIKLDWFPKGTFKKRYPTIWHWWSSFGGWHIEEALESGSELALWKAILPYLGGYHDSSKPDPDLATVRADLRRWAKYAKLKDRVQKFIEYHVDKPQPAYIKVEPEWVRRGIGSALYHEAARWLAKKGLALHASASQTAEAKAVWQSMQGHPAMRPGDRLSLDFR